MRKSSSLFVAVLSSTTIWAVAVSVTSSRQAMRAYLMMSFNVFKCRSELILLQFVENVHNTLQLLFIVEGNADLALSFG